jgi:hypothetical protein
MAGKGVCAKVGGQPEEKPAPRPVEAPRDVLAPETFREARLRLAIESALRWFDSKISDRSDDDVAAELDAALVATARPATGVPPADSGRPSSPASNGKPSEETSARVNEGPPPRDVRAPVTDRTTQLAALLAEWRRTEFFKDPGEWKAWVADFGARVDAALTAVNWPALPITPAPGLEELAEWTNRPRDVRTLATGRPPDSRPSTLGGQQHADALVQQAQRGAELALEALVRDLMYAGELDRANKVRFHAQALQRALAPVLRLTVGPTAYICPFCVPLGETAFASVADCNAHIRSRHPERAALLDMKGTVRVVGVVREPVDELDQRTPDSERES